MKYPLQQRTHCYLSPIEYKGHSHYLWIVPFQFKLLVRQTLRTKVDVASWFDPVITPFRHFLMMSSLASESRVNQGVNLNCCLGHENGEACRLCTHNSTQALIRVSRSIVRGDGLGLVVSFEAVVLVAVNRSPQAKSRNAEALVNAALSGKKQRPIIKLLFWSLPYTLSTGGPCWRPPKPVGRFMSWRRRRIMVAQVAQHSISVQPRSVPRTQFGYLMGRVNAIVVIAQ